MLRRRILLATGAAALATPHIARSQTAKTLKFVPQIDVPLLDPVVTSAYISRNHGFVVFDTLFGQDSAFKAQPQMVDGFTTASDGKMWRLTLRDGLKFHDGTGVLARDCVASINRWGKRDAFGQALMAATDELSAADDKTIVFRLKPATFCQAMRPRSAIVCRCRSRIVGAVSLGTALERGNTMTDTSGCRDTTSSRTPS